MYIMDNTRRRKSEPRKRLCRTNRRSSGDLDISAYNNTYNKHVVYRVLTKQHDRGTYRVNRNLLASLFTEFFHFTSICDRSSSKQNNTKSCEKRVIHHSSVVDFLFFFFFSRSNRFRFNNVIKAQTPAC